MACEVALLCLGSAFVVTRGRAVPPPRGLAGWYGPAHWPQPTQQGAATARQSATGCRPGYTPRVCTLQPTTQKAPAAPPHGMGCGASTICSSSRVSAVLDSSRCCSSPHFRDSCLITQDDEKAATDELSAAEDGDAAIEDLDTFSDMGSTALLEECEAVQRLAALPDGELFRDEDFPAETSSLSHSDPQAPHLADVVWLRPHELVAEPRLLEEGSGVAAVRQGALGDCWLLSACAAVAQRPHLLRKVVAGGQALVGAGYRGAVRVRLWRFGRWRCVLLDDLLPTRAGALLYASCAAPHLFWVCFVEKAYAKLHGSYESLAGGHALEALVDLTGGVAEKLRSSPALYPLLRDAFARGDLVTCAKKGNWASVSAVGPFVRESGLARGHAYTVREVRQVRVSRRPLRMVRVRNPWADDREWTGAWSDGDGRWQLLDEETRREMGALEPAPDGEFWMEFRDFQRHFTEVTVATLAPDLHCDDAADAANGNADSSRRYVEVCHGEWVAGRSAGGCRNDLSKFTTNPQFLLTLTTSDGGGADDDGDGGGDEGGGDGECGVLVALMQELRRAERNRLLRALPIAVFLYKAGDPPERRLDAAHFEQATEVGSSGAFVNSREVSCRARLPAPARYVLVPAAFHPGHARAFMLRVFSQRPLHLRPLTPH